MAGRLTVTKTRDVGAQPVPVVAESRDGIKFNRAGWSTSLHLIHQQLGNIPPDNSHVLGGVANGDELNARSMQGLGR
jgi:hypothetical protein